VPPDSGRYTTLEATTSSVGTEIKWILTATSYLSHLDTAALNADKKPEYLVRKRFEK